MCPYLCPAISYKTGGHSQCYKWQARSRKPAISPLFRHPQVLFQTTHKIRPMETIRPLIKVHWSVQVMICPGSAVGPPSPWSPWELLYRGILCALPRLVCGNIDPKLWTTPLPHEGAPWILSSQPCSQVELRPAGAVGPPRGRARGRGGRGRVDCSGSFLKAGSLLITGESGRD